MNPFQQPPTFSSKIPMEAQGLVMQPEALQMLAQVQGFDLLALFYMQMPFMMLEKDKIMLEKGGQNLIKYALLGLTVGVVANVQLKRLPVRFLERPWFVRYPVRIATMMLPFALLAQPIMKAGDDILNTVIGMERRKARLVRNRDLEEYYEVKKPAPEQKKK